MKKYFYLLVFSCTWITFCHQAHDNHYQLANRYYAFSMYAKAVEEYKLALSSNIPEELKSECYFLLAETHRKLGNTEEAIRSYRNHVGKYPRSNLNWKCYLNLGILISLRGLSETGESERYFNAAMESATSKKTKAYISLEQSEMLLREKQYRKSYMILKNINPSNLSQQFKTRYFNNIGKIMLQGKNYTGALEQFRKSYDLGDTSMYHLDTLMGLTMCYQHLGMESNLEQVLSELSRNYPSSTKSLLVENLVTRKLEYSKHRKESLDRLQQSLDQLALSSFPAIQAHEESFQIQADSTIYSGNVNVISKNYLLNADKLEFSKDGKLIRAESVTLTLPETNMTVTANLATYNFQQGYITMEDSLEISGDNAPLQSANAARIDLHTGSVNLQYDHE